jgi:hypothetical protein
VSLLRQSFKKALNTKQFAGKVDADARFGVYVVVQGIPTPFVNGKRVQNTSDYAADSPVPIVTSRVMAYCRALH